MQPSIQGRPKKTVRTHCGGRCWPAAARWPASGAAYLNGVIGRAALCVGAELSSRLDLAEDQYAGFDPTGVAAPFGATAAAVVRG